MFKRKITKLYANFVQRIGRNKESAPPDGGHSPQRDGASGEESSQSLKTEWHLDRFIQTSFVTLGKLYNKDNSFGLYTIELPWRNNERRVSCIPEGEYEAELDFYHKGGYPAYELREVPNRTEIKIHIGNFTHDVLGCIAVGMGYDSTKPMVTNSRKGFEKFMEYMKGIDKFKLTIRKL